MKKTSLLLLLAAAILLPTIVLARDIAPLVSTDWLAKNLNKAKLVIVDIRKVEEYREGHIPSSISVFYGTWAIKKNATDNELPEVDDLLDILSSAGIKEDSRVVVVGKCDTLPDRVNMTRVAWTIIYGGVENVAVLDGGFNKWTSEKKPVSTETAKPKSSAYKGRSNKNVLADKEYVLSKAGKSILLDSRMPDFFFGVSKLGIVQKAGHIQGAVNLPSAWIFTKEGTFKGMDDLEAMARGVVGQETDKEVIVYCDTGRLASGWWFVLHEALNYKDVKLFDGSMQELTRDPKAPVQKYTWH